MDKAHGYGAAGAAHLAPSPHGHQDLQLGGSKPLGQTIIKPPASLSGRKRMNLVAIFLSLFVPWVLFCVACGVMSFGMHYRDPQTAYAVVIICAVVACAFGVPALTVVRERWQGRMRQDIAWYVFLFVTSMLAVGLGAALGDGNYNNYMQAFLDLESLNAYVGVDPARMKGQQIMDAGRVTFVQGAHLDLSKAYAFQNGPTYCVAPVTVASPIGNPNLPLYSYDFWAVGMDCCETRSTAVNETVNFKCGPFANNANPQGLRIVADSTRSFYRLAVQQAESAHRLRAVHPLFFEWTTDAETSWLAYKANAYRSFALYMCAYFIFQLFLVVLMTYIFASLFYPDVLSRAEHAVFNKL